MPFNAATWAETSLSKLVPETEIVSPTLTTAGVTPVIDGPFAAGSIVNGTSLVAEALPTVTVTGPVVAPSGTMTTNRAGLAEVTVAAVPLNCTRFAAGESEKQPPEMVTAVPGAPERGVTDITDRAGVLRFCTLVPLPTSSYP